MTPLRHAQLVYKRARKARKGAKAAREALNRIVHDILRAEVAARLEQPRKAA